MAVFLMPLIPLAIEETILIAGAAGLAITLAPAAVEAAGHVVEVGARATKQLWEVTQERPPSPPRRNSEEDLNKKLKKKAIKTILEDAVNIMMITDIIKDNQVNAWGPMENLTQMVDVMKLKDQHVWCGYFNSGPPPNNRKYETATDKMKKNPADVISHLGVPPSGSKAGVAYSAHFRQWILAWHVPLRSSSSTPNKIYVEYGPERPIDWNVIEKRLDASSNTSQCDGAYAEINNEANASMTAVFYE